MRLLLALLPFFALAAESKPIRVLVWDEQQPQQSQGYGDKFLGETLATELAKNKDLVVKTARLADADQGLSDAALDQADVAQRLTQSGQVFIGTGVAGNENADRGHPRLLRAQGKKGS